MEVPIPITAIRITMTSATPARISQGLYSFRIFLKELVSNYITPCKTDEKILTAICTPQTMISVQRTPTTPTSFRVPVFTPNNQNRIGIGQKSDMPTGLKKSSAR